MQSNRTRAVTSLGVTTAVALGTLASGVGGAGASTGRTPGTPPAISRPRAAGSTDLGALGTVGTLTAVSSTSISITDPAGATITYALTSRTVVRRGGVTVAGGALQVGMTVAVLVATADAAAAVTVVVVPPTDLGALGTVGTLTAVSSTSISITDPAGATITYALTPATRVQVGPVLVSAASLVAGQLVRVETTPATPAVVSAIQMEPAHMEGVVTAVNGGVITLGDPQGFERSVLVSAATTYRDARGVATLDSVRVGSTIVATGVVGGDRTSLDAVAVDVGSVARSVPRRWRGAFPSPAGSRGWARRSGHPPRNS
ncbi:MAG: hypothetical protein ACP5OV_03225 [Acidimicrobiales bacterium]